jgi:NDP-hexose-3-ketoreductase
MNSLRTAVWGLGRHGAERIVPAVAAAAGLQLHGVCSRDTGRMTACAERWRCRTWTDAAAMLEDPAVDVVFVATPTGLHAEHGAQALRAGKHLWCEKPLTTDRQSTLDLLDLSRARGLSVCEGHMHLYHPQLRQLSRMIADGRLGTVRSVASRFGIPPLEFDSFRSDPARGGSALLDVGCYPVSTVQALFPLARQRVVYSRITAREGFGVDTDGLAVLELSNGVTAQFEWRTNSAYRNEIEIWGDKGSVFTDKIYSKPADYVPVFRLRDLRGVETQEAGQAANHFVNMLEAFRAIAPGGQLAEEERSRIAWRAEILDEIRCSVGASAPLGAIKHPDEKGTR